jgi:acyl carrier protein
MFANTLKNAFQKRYPMGGGRGGPNDTDWLQSQLDTYNWNELTPITDSAYDLFGSSSIYENPQYTTGTGTVQPQPASDQLYNVGTNAAPNTTSFTGMPVNNAGVTVDLPPVNTQVWDEGEIINKYGDYSKSNFADLLGISKKELENRAKDAGFDSTQAYYESGQWQSQPSAQTTTPTYMDDNAFSSFLDTVRNAFTVQPVYAQGSDLETTGSAIQYGDTGQSVQGPSLGQRIGDWFGNLNAPELGISEILGGRTGSLGMTGDTGYGSYYTNYLPQQYRNAFNALSGPTQPGYTPAGSFANTGNSGIAFDGASSPTVSTIQASPAAQPVVNEQGEIVGEQSTDGSVLGTQATPTQQPPTTSQQIQNEYGGLLDGLNLGQTGEDLINQMTPVYDDLQTQVEVDRERDIANLEAQYDYLQRNYDNLTADAKAEADLAMTKIKQALDYGYGQGEEARGRVQRMFADAIKKAVKTGRAGEQRLRNIFSSLGTADSSAFIEAMAQGEQALGADIRGLRQEELRNVGQIENYLQQLTQENQNKVAELQINLNSTLNNIMNNRMLSEQQKTFAMQEAQSQAMNILADLRLHEQNMRMQIPMQLAGLEAQIAATLGSSMYGNFNVPSYGTDSMYDQPIEWAQSAPETEGSTRYGADGRLYVYRNGRWVLAA